MVGRELRGTSIRRWRHPAQRHLGGSRRFGVRSDRALPGGSCATCRQCANHLGSRNRPSRRCDIDGVLAAGCLTRRTIVAGSILRRPRWRCDRWRQRLPYGSRSRRCRFGLIIALARHPRVDANERKIGNRDSRSRHGGAVGRLLSGTAAVLRTPAGMGSRRGRPGSYQLCRICEARTAPRSAQLSRDDRVHR